MDREENDQRVVVLLALIRAWHNDHTDNEDPPTWRGPQLIRIRAIAGQFDARTTASNDPSASPAHYLTVLVFLMPKIAQTRSIQRYLSANQNPARNPIKPA